MSSDDIKPANVVETTNNIVETSVDSLVKSSSEVASAVVHKTNLSSEVNKNLEVVDKVYHIVKDNLRGLSIDMYNMTVLIAKVIEVADRVKLMSGPEKKSLVNDVCLRFVKNDIKLPENEIEFVSLTLSTLVDVILGVSKGEFKINLKRNKKNKTLSNIAPTQVVESLLDKLVTIIKNRQYSAQDIVVNLSILTGMVMTIIEQYPDFSGIEKKNIVMQVLRRLISEELPKIVDVPENVKNMLNVGLNTLPETIDILVAVGRGKFDINPENGQRIINLIIKCIMPFCMRKRDTIE